ncbi:class I SAM-dependent methyltransferase [Planctomicrobium piriforme]|uniref:Lysine methyltransferase n=1 Tax=Planctomicrobium piriforme TaxID=1576369 RepID=A0A1I3ND44_9PLAN|nr:methyltransferase [Planctomicrobium piriforme]SFJ07089.1 Lysine methyltransferase [Planctomicrobium piriforme]
MSDDETPSDVPELALPSAFPVLSSNPDELPAVPGGWQHVEIPIGQRSLKLHRPLDPDLFLDDAKVQSENSRHDYMPYWAFLWPSSVPMANLVLNAPWPVGTNVLELGAGIGLVGLAAALRGDRVTFSDYDHTALHMCRLNARLNGLPDPELWFLDWRDVPARQFPVIVGCEVTYDAGLHEPLLDAISALLAPDGVCWLGDPGRYQAKFFYDKAAARGFHLQLFNAAGERQTALSSGEFQLLAITRTSGSATPTAERSLTPV